MCFPFWLREWDLNLTHRSHSRCLSLDTLASPTPCSAVSTVVKTILYRFNLGRKLFALCTQGVLGLITSNVVEHRVRTCERKRKNTPRGCVFSFLVAGVGFEPHDLRVMSPTSYQTAPSRDIWCRKPGSNRYEKLISRDFKSRASANSAIPA